MPNEIDSLFTSALNLLDGADTYTVIELLTQQDAQSAAGVYGKLQKELYWQRKDIPRMVAMSRAGIRHALTAAQHSDDETVSSALRHSGKAIAYNLASFTWPGWNELGVLLTASDLAVGLDAAHLNLRLAESLNRPEKGKAAAHWAVGAHQLARADYDLAVLSFQTGKLHAAADADALFERLLEGYVLMAGCLRNPQDDDVRSDFDNAVSTLRQDGSNDAQEFAGQLTAAFTALSA